MTYCKKNYYCENQKICHIFIAHDNGASYSSFKLGDFEKAKEFIAESIVYDDSSAVVLEHYGDVLIALDNRDEALVFYKKALELDRDSSSLSEKISSYKNE